MTVFGANRTKTEGQTNWHRTYLKLIDLTKKMGNADKSPGAKIYGLRMYDLVLGRDKPSRSPLEKVCIKKVIKSSFSLQSALSWKTPWNF